MTLLYLTVVLVSCMDPALAHVLSAHPTPHALVLAQGSHEGRCKAAGGKFGFLVLTQLQND